MIAVDSSKPSWWWSSTSFLRSLWVQHGFRVSSQGVSFAYQLWQHWFQIEWSKAMISTQCKAGCFSWSYIFALKRPSISIWRPKPTCSSDWSHRSSKKHRCQTCSMLSQTVSSYAQKASILRTHAHSMQTRRQALFLGKTFSTTIFRRKSPWWSLSRSMEN